MVGWIRKSALLWGIAASVLLVSLGTPRLWDRDEPRNAGCAEEMLARHDWVVPVFNGELRSHKPVLLYWCIMAARQLPIDREFAARLPSVIMGFGTVLVTCLLGRRLFGDVVGRAASLILLTSLMFLVAARAATPDSLLIFFSTLSLYLFVLAVFPESAVTAAVGPDEPSGTPAWKLTWTAALGIYAVMALGVLAKGPVGLVLPLAVLVAFAQLDRQTRPPVRTGSRRRHLRAMAAWWLAMFRPRRLVEVGLALRPSAMLLALAAVAAPWYLWVGYRTQGVWLAEFLGEHNWGRALRPMEGHQGGIWFYPLAILVGFFPWSVFAVPLGVYCGQLPKMSFRERRGILFLMVWVAAYVGVFSLARTKLPSYVTPAYPALALLMAKFLHVAALPRPNLVTWMRASFGSLLVVGITLVVVLPILAHRWLPGAEWVGLVGFVPIGTGAAAWWFWSCHERAAFHRSLFAGATLFALFVFGILAPRVDRNQQSHQLLDVTGLRDPATHVAAYGVLEPSWVYYAERPICEITRGDQHALQTFLSGSGPSFLITTHDDALDVMRDYPRTVSRLAEVPYFMRSGQLVLLATRPATSQATVTRDAQRR